VAKRAQRFAPEIIEVRRIAADIPQQADFGNAVGRTEKILKKADVNASFRQLKSTRVRRGNP
jgi:hypothetical protein